MNSTITMGKEYKELVYKGVKKAVDVIALTYGYNGKYVKIDNGEEFKNDITNDGYKVSQQIYSDNPIEDIGCGIIREATKMMETKNKNGTTTTAIMIGSLVKGMIGIPNDINILEVKDSIEELSDIIIDYITNDSKIVDNIYDVAFGSCHDKEMAEFVVDMMDKYDEFYETSKSYSDEYKVEYKENERRVPVRLLSRKGKSTIEDPYVVIHNGIINNSNVSIVSDSLFSFIKGRDTILIIKNINKASTEYIAARMAMHDKDIMLFDVHGLDTIDFITDFYQKQPVLLANKQVLFNVIKDIDKFSSKGTISGKVQVEEVDKRVNEFKKQISEGHNDHRADIVRKKINDYMGRIYKISLKSNSYNFEGQKDKFLDVINDIISHRKSENKVVHGGGVAFKDAANYILDFKNDKKASKETLVAINIMVEALRSPINELLLRSYVNADYNNYQVEGNGYNAYTGIDCNMIDNGIITPLISFVNTINVVKDIATEWLLTDASIVVNHNNKGEE